MAKNNLKPKKRKTKGKYTKYYIASAVVVLAFGIYLLFKPYEGTIQYGVCKVFIELADPYPEEVKSIGIEQVGQTLRYYYKKTDPFGDESVNLAECTFKANEAGKLTPYLDKVNINGNRTYKVEDPEYIKKFNVGVPAIVANPPSLVLPYYNLNDIKTYRDIE